MGYQEFMKTMKGLVQSRLGEGTEVRRHTVLKNNGERQEGFVIVDGKTNIAPTVYLRSYFEEYKKGRNIDEIADDIVNVYRENRMAKDVDVDTFLDYQKTKDNVIFKLVSRERNEELLREVPHVDYLDLAIVFCCLLYEFGEGMGTVLIRNEHLTFWKVDANELYRQAMVNTPKLLPWRLINLRELIFQGTSRYPGEDDDLGMFALTNEKRLFGAGCVLYQDVLEQCGQRFGRSFFIIPSSIHEVLLLPLGDQDDAERLSEIVRDVNRTAVSRGEILSDHVYFYDWSENSVLPVSQAA